MDAQRPQKITPDRVAALAETHEDDEIASILGISENHVRLMLTASAATRRRWHIRCNRTGRRTGRRIEARSQRGAYRMACLLGLTDWDWWPECTQGDQA